MPTQSKVLWASSTQRPMAWEQGHYKEMPTFEVLLVTRPLTYSTPWIQSKCCQLDERRENMFIQNLSISLKISYSFSAARMFFQVNETTGRSQQRTLCCVRQHLLTKRSEGTPMASTWARMAETHFTPGKAHAELAIKQQKGTISYILVSLHGALIRSWRS